MNKKQFKNALLRGQGRCIQTLKENPEKYYPIMIWACSHEVSFDAQCEGSRAWFVYQLINCYQNKTPFLEAAITSFQNTKSNGGWQVLYLAELLSHFRDDGEKTAEHALWQKYEKLYSTLLEKKHIKEGLFPEKDDFSMLCVVLAESKSAIIKIASDIGKLYQKKSFYDGFDFDWLYETKAKRYMRTLIKQSKHCPNIAEYLRVGQEGEKNCAEFSNNHRENAPKKGIALSRWLKNSGDKETIQQYADIYLNEIDPEKRAEALKAFSRCPFPENPMPIIDDTTSDCTHLKEAAWRALENIRHPFVREFSILHMYDEIETALPVFIANYQTQDEEQLVTLVKSIPIDFKCTTAWHGIHLDVLHMGDNKLNVPASLLYHIYENTYCSCCREYALRQMGKRRLLTDDILQECLLDSNEDIRIYAKRCINRRKNNIQKVSNQSYKNMVKI